MTFSDDLSPELFNDAFPPVCTTEWQDICKESEGTCLLSI